MHTADDITTDGDITAGGDVTVTGAVSTATAAVTTSHTLTGPNGSSLVRGYATELLTMAQAATTESTIQIPVGATNVSVCGRVTGLAATTATYAIGITGDTSRFESSVAVAATTTFRGHGDALDEYATATKVLITPNAQPTDDNGKIRLVIYYDTVTPPTS